MFGYCCLYCGMRKLYYVLPPGYISRQEHIKGGGGGKELVTEHPGCGPGESCDLCLNILSQQTVGANIR